MMFEISALGEEENQETERDSHSLMASLPPGGGSLKNEPHPINDEGNEIMDPLARSLTLVREVLTSSGRGVSST